ncbi:MAG: hypothetical protein N3G80_01970 [Candidatus Micrarchaeota archaeon]|nr:hypothetical protein [Candidatus Micrarchaeota archaeon]
MQNNVSNVIQVQKAVVIGPLRETQKIRAELESILWRKIQVESILTVKSGTTQKRTREEVLPELIEKIRGADGRTIVISDIGDDRPYKGEQIAIDVKEYSNAAFALITSNLYCCGSLEKFAEFVKDRGFDPNVVIPKIDYVFQYTGQAEIFPAMVELHESKLNYKLDNERLILIFESKPNYYSGYLVELFKLNEKRAHILLAREYSEAEKFIIEGKNRFAGAILGLRNIELSFELAKMLRAYNKTVPIIFQSGAQEKLQKASEKHIGFVISKSDPLLFKKVGDILRDFFGFGDFIFRTPSGIEIGRAKNLAELCEYIEKIDDASLIAHASRDDFSNWLYMHGYKKAAETIKPLFTSDPVLLRKLLLADLKHFIKEG